MEVIHRLLGGDTQFPKRDLLKYKAELHDKEILVLQNYIELKKSQPWYFWKRLRRFMEEQWANRPFFFQESKDHWRGFKDMASKYFLQMEKFSSLKKMDHQSSSGDHDPRSILEKVLLQPRYVLAPFDFVPSRAGVFKLDSFKTCGLQFPEFLLQSC
uniref:Uncharacterized protein n=1 Tax=Naja naja TaxID=35670 RepID=A0A8C6YLQ3_NAJNA